jgi:hypothetical protein
MRKLLVPIAAALPMLAGGCVAKTVWDVATLPVKAGSQVVDWTTTSQSESDRNYGRKMRKKEAEEGKARRKHDQECKRHPERECEPYEGVRASEPN